MVMRRALAAPRAVLGRLVLPLAAVLVLAACPPRKPPDVPGTVTPERLPRDVPSLLRYAGPRLEGSFDRLRTSDALVALTKARGLAPTDAVVLRQGAQAAQRLAETAASKGEQLKYADQGLVFAEAGRSAHAADASFHYLYAALLGLRVDAYRITAAGSIPRIVAACEKAIAIDQRLDHAGPLRVLGSLLYQAPETPPFNGDLDRGIKLLEEAATLAPGYGPNHYFLGQAYRKDGRQDPAAASLARAVCAPDGEGFAAVQTRQYRDQARRALRQLGRTDAPPCR